MASIDLEQLNESLRQRQAANRERRIAEGLPVLPWGAGPDPAPEPGQDAAVVPPPAETVKVYPSIATAGLQQGQAKLQRLYYLALALDPAGSGCVDIDALRATYADKRNRTHYAMTWRHMRGLLAQGDGIYWTRGKHGRLWLHSAARIAAKLKLERLAGLPVEIPLEKLTGGIGDVKAALYATFHAGRKENNPISRGKLAQLIGVGETTQRTYEQKTGIIVRENHAIGQAASQAAVQDAAWKHGNVYICKDWQGKHGERGAKYVAWQLPNKFEAHYPQMPKGRQSKINRALSSYYEGRGNGDGFSRIYYQDSKAAEKAYKHSDVDQVIYYGGAPTIRPDINQQPTRLGAVAFWYPLEAGA